MSEKKEGGFTRYKRVTIGNKGILFLLIYEVITTVFGFIPGLIGYAFRKIFYSLLLHRKSRGFLIGANVVIRCPKKILLQRGAYIEDQVVLAACDNEREHTIRLGDNSYVRSFAVLNSGYPDGFIDIGDNTSIANGVQIHGHGGVTIGNGVMVAGQSYIVASSHNYDDTDKYMYEQGFSAKGITIEDDVWIGANVKIMDGVTIKKGAIIGAGSFVNCDIEEYSISVGSPCKVIKKRK